MNGGEGWREEKERRGEGVKEGVRKGVGGEEGKEKGRRGVGKGNRGGESR